MPLAQVDLLDRDKLAVRIQNNGVGPLIVQSIHYLKDGLNHPHLADCLTLSARSFQHVTLSPPEQKIILVGAYLEVFSKRLKENDTEEQINDLRNQLAPITVQVKGKDIYNNAVVVERSLGWSLRHDVV